MRSRLRVRIRGFFDDIVRLQDFWPPTMGNVSYEYTLYLVALLFPFPCTCILQPRVIVPQRRRRLLSRDYLTFQENVLDRTFSLLLYILL